MTSEPATNETLSHCDPCTERCTRTASLSEFLLRGVLLNSVNLVGLVCNSTSVYILSRPPMRSSTSCCLIGLAVYDMLLLASSVFIWGVPAITGYTGYWRSLTEGAIPAATPWLFPLANIAHTGSTYVTVAVTVERYVAVCHPLRSRSVCTYGRARLYMLIISALVVLYNVPRFLEAELRPLPAQDGAPDGYTVCASALRAHPVYIAVYVVWLYLLVMYCLPFGTLLVLNTLIYRHVQVANRTRQLLSRQQQREIGLATLLFAIVLLFLTCNSLAFVINIIELARSTSSFDLDGATLAVLTDVSTLLVNISSASNFFLYCIFGRKFRRLFLRIFCGAVRRKIRQWRAANGELTTTAAEGTAAGVEVLLPMAQRNSRVTAVTRTGEADGAVTMAAAGPHRVMRNGQR
ncbi:FMRFamide receptor-like [Amphibalanus amphitrite]|uniref:FMRFamide receptor-like n=1 Tax=Amphibalanus amphitrite TaxID=1232801 RepID=UPI001C91BFB8|nr:FMRFamide receptor-like [Amphibalanus amphitrite]